MDRRLRRAVRVIQHPVIAGVLFVGLIDLWLIPAVNFEAMIDPRLYAIMNWSMVVDGLLFWCLVLDPRSSPPARASFAVRMITTILVMFPQIILGSYLDLRGSRPLFVLRPLRAAVPDDDRVERPAHRQALSSRFRPP